MNRWFRLIAAVVAMIMIANLQYAWTLFVKPLVAAKHWKLSDIQWGFTFFIAFETWVMPCSGWLIDRLGPRAFMSIAGILCGAGWAALGHADSLSELYVFYSIAGFGAALVYCGSMGIALKWFPDKRGLAAGLIAAGFGSGSALFTWLIARLIHDHGYQTAFLYTGVAQGLIIVLAAQFLENPATVQIAKASATSVKVRSHGEDFTSWEMLQTPHFYLLFGMALMMGIGGLMVTAQVAPMADSYKIGAAALSLALFLNPLANGGGRLFWGMVSDVLGRERTMFIAFFLQSIFLLSMVTIGRTSPALFITCSALIFFTWGEVYSLFPSASADFFGVRNASSNYSFIYSAKGVASIMGGGLAAALYEKTGSWNYGFYACAALALITAFCALGLRRMPLPIKHQQPRPQPVAAQG
ncbi:MAG TPA: oxalate/formate MFS antiporter [Bryobacteraceae bacterium]|nr:oxalate/formate MFS antiporter [Bryobacteraceae bacterium]